MIEIKEIQAITNLFVAALKDRLASDGSNATHTLSNSIKDIVKVDDKYITVSIQLEDYWKYLENGRKAGKFPPVEKIKEWIKVKPVIPYSKDNNKLPSENQLTFLIGRKISKGTSPNPFLAPTIKDFGLVDKLYSAIQSMLTNEINEVIDEELK